MYALAAMAFAAAHVYTCVWHSSKPESYSIQWMAGSLGDRCMRLAGSNAGMTVTDQGLTCTSLGHVSIDRSGMCYFRQSYWGVSYLATGAPYSGSMSSLWEAGPANSDITLRDQSPGTSVCSQKARCKQSFLEWDNDKTADIYIVFEPEKMEKFSGEEAGEESEESEEMIEDKEQQQQQQQL